MHESKFIRKTGAEEKDIRRPLGTIGVKSLILTFEKATINMPSFIFNSMDTTLNCEVNNAPYSLIIPATIYDHVRHSNEPAEFSYSRNSSYGTLIMG
jgi:hypothetical protein